MALPEIVDRSEWLVARKALLAREKELTRARDALSADRRRLPMVRIEKDYVFTGPQGQATLLDLFEGRDQLILTHFMFDPSWDQGCPSCTAGADEVSRACSSTCTPAAPPWRSVSRAPIDKIERYKAERGWEFPWWSSYGSDFNVDFHVTLDPAQAPVMFNYRSAAGVGVAGRPAVCHAGQPAGAARATASSSGWGRGVPHLLRLRPRHGVDRWLLRVPGPDSPGPPGGVGGAQRPSRPRAR